MTAVSCIKCIYLIMSCNFILGFSGGSEGKESVCNAGDLGWEDFLEKGMATHYSISVF